MIWRQLYQDPPAAGSTIVVREGTEDAAGQKLYTRPEIVGTYVGSFTVEDATGTAFAVARGTGFEAHTMPRNPEYLVVDMSDKVERPSVSEIFRWFAAESAELYGEEVKLSHRGIGRIYDLLERLETEGLDLGLSCLRLDLMRTSMSEAAWRARKPGLPRGARLHGTKVQAVGRTRETKTRAEFFAWPDLGPEA